MSASTTKKMENIHGIYVENAIKTLFHFCAAQGRQKKWGSVFCDHMKAEVI
jgi:hypothetical protein